MNTYAAFTRHLTPKDEPEATPPAPVEPAARVVGECVARLTAIDAALTDAQAQVLRQLPDDVRLKLSKLLLVTAEKNAAALAAFLRYEAHGTLTPSKGAAPRKKRQHAR